MKFLLPLLFSFAALTWTVAHAAPGDADAGQAKSQTCAACHNADGNSQNPIYPILAGQYRNYLVQALHEYRSGSRNNPIMKGFAAGLSDEDILDLAAYFSSQSSVLVTPKPE
ncbi:MAG: hypothetical protein DHS20C01_02830 [marine bacterium B5-7]|nr:MAG: hypothetical protein DHS20C01_02830 [marine bacterium B5-7]